MWVAVFVLWVVISQKCGLLVLFVISEGVKCFLLFLWTLFSFCPELTSVCFSCNQWRPRLKLALKYFLALQKELDPVCLVFCYLDFQQEVLCVPHQSLFLWIGASFKAVWKLIRTLIQTKKLNGPSKFGFWTLVWFTIIPEKPKEEKIWSGKKESSKHQSLVIEVKEKFKKSLLNSCLNMDYNLS